MQERLEKSAMTLSYYRIKVKSASMKSQEWMKVFQDNFIFGDRAASQSRAQFFIYYSFFAKKVVRLTHPAVAKGVQPVGGCHRLSQGCHDWSTEELERKGYHKPGQRYTLAGNSLEN